MYPCPFMFFLPLFVTDIPPTNRQNWLCFKTVFKIWPCSFPPQKRGLRTACMGNWSFQKQSIWKCAYWSITFDFGLHDGVDVRTVGRSDGRTVGRSVGRTVGRSVGRSVVRWRHNQNFSDGWVTIFSSARAELRYKYILKVNKTGLLWFDAWLQLLIRLN